MCERHKKSSSEVVMVKPLFVIVQSVCPVFWDCLLCQLIIVDILPGRCVLTLVHCKYFFSEASFSLSFGFQSTELALLSFLHRGLWKQHSRMILGYFGEDVSCVCVCSWGLQRQQVTTKEHTRVCPTLSPIRAYSPATLVSAQGSNFSRLWLKPSFCPLDS